MCKKIIPFLFLSLLYSPLFAQGKALSNNTPPLSNASPAPTTNDPLKKDSKTTVIKYSSNNSIIISLSNKHDGGSWNLNLPANDKNISLVNTRDGQLFTYFTLKVAPDYKGMIEFNYNNKNRNMQSRSFFLMPNPSPTPSANAIYGDVPVNSAGEDFLDQATNAKPKAINNLANSVLNPQTLSKTVVNNSTKQDTKAPATPLLDPQNIVNPDGKNTPDPALEPPVIPIVSQNPPTPLDQTFKLYLATLLKEGLYDQARDKFEAYIKDTPPTDTEWLHLTDIEISKLAGKEDEIVDKTSKLMNNKEDFKAFSKDTQFKIIESRALAYESLKKLDDATTDLLYLNTYYKDNPFAYYDLGKYYLRHNQIEKALNSLTYLTTAFPDFPYADEVFFDLGNYYYKVVGINGYNLSLNYFKKVLDYGITSNFYTKASDIVNFLENNFFNIK